MYLFILSRSLNRVGLGPQLRLLPGNAVAARIAGKAPQNGHHVHNSNGHNGHGADNEDDEEGGFVATTSFRGSRESLLSANACDQAVTSGGGQVVAAKNGGGDKEVLENVESSV